MNREDCLDNERMSEAVMANGKIGKAAKQSNEQVYYETLRRIAHYQSPDQLRRGSGKQFGLGFEECLEMAYENVIQEAHNALRGRRRPKV